MDNRTETEEPQVSGNVTFDPLAMAIPVTAPEIREVLDLTDGAFIDATEYIGGHVYADLIATRVKIKEQLDTQPLYACALCGTPVYIVSTQKKRFFFRHRVEHGSCPAITRGALTQEEIRARKYHGLRESEAHKRIKNLILQSLEADRSFSDTKAERWWRSRHDPRARRQPDVQTRNASGRFAFEVQLSTTFLDVVAGRRSFYREENAQLIWVLGGFDPRYRRLTTDDLLFSNNSNIFVVDDETLRVSQEADKFHLRCHYRTPRREGDEIVDDWMERVVAFDQIVCEPDRQRSWYFDYEGAYGKLFTEITQERIAREDAADSELRNAFAVFWLEREVNRTDAGPSWAALRSDLQRRGIGVPEEPDRDTSMCALLNGLYSAREGSPVGWRFRHLVEVGHRLAEYYPQHLLAYGYAIALFGRRDLIARQDRSGKWQRRAAQFRQAIQNGEESYMPPSELLPLVDLLFPEIGEKLGAFINKRKSVQEEAAA